MKWFNRFLAICLLLSLTIVPVQASSQGRSWVYPKFLNGWENYGGEYAPASYYKANGRVYLRGWLKNGGRLKAMFRLEPAYRPPYDLQVPVVGYGVPDNAIVSLCIGKSGIVSLAGAGSNNWVSLDEVNFSLK